MSDENEWNQKIITEFRANGGQVGGHFTGQTLLLLHTIGAKSQQERINPVACVQDGERLVIAATNDGAERHSSWYYNLVANPVVTIEVGPQQFQARATIAEEPERTRLYDKMVAAMPGFADYPAKAKRVIPVVVLTRIK